MAMQFGNDTKTIQNLLFRIENYNKQDGIDLQPKYQRGYIWSSEFKDKLIFSIIRGYPIGSINMRIRSRTDKNEKGSTQEVVDGQQRLTTIHNFVNKDYSVQSDVSKKIVEYIIDFYGNEQDDKLEKLQKRAKKSKLSLKYSQLPDLIRSKIDSHDIAITNITDATDSEIAEYFKFLQNQERLRAGEIINSVPASVLEQYLDKIENLDGLLKKLSFRNERRQFDKAFYNVLGIIDNKIGLGITDKVIIEYASNCSDLSGEAREKCATLLRQLNHISSHQEIQVTKSNVRFIKFLLLLSSMGFVDFTDKTKDKIATLELINNKLSSFNSAKADMIKLEFPDYSNEVVEEFRLIALVTKGGHSFIRVNQRMKILAHYINNPQNKTNPSKIDPEGVSKKNRAYYITD